MAPFGNQAGGLAIGWQSKLAAHEVAENMKKAVALWTC